MRASLLFFSVYLISFHLTAQGVIFPKVFRDEISFASGYNSLSRSILVLDSQSYFLEKRVSLTFRNLSLIPDSFRKRKSGFSFFTASVDPCIQEEVLQHILTRKDIRTQLFSQQQHNLNHQQLDRFEQIYKAALSRGNLILKSDSVFIDSFLRNFTSAEESFQYYEREIHNTFLHFKQQASNTLIQNRLQREEELAIRSMNNERENANRKFKAFRKYIKKGKGNQGYFSDRIWHLDFGDLPGGEIFFKAFSGKGNFATIRFDTLPVARSERFIQVDSFACRPVYRYLYYKELPGYNFKRANYKNKYQPGSSVAGFKDFTLFFEHNKSDYDRKDIEPILNFLKDSSYVVQQAKVLAFASVEGDSLNNQRLQEERARILIDLIQQEQAEDSIELVEITTSENWDMFFDQIKTTSYRNWNKKTRLEIKELLQDDSIALLLEPVLAPERFSTLKLKVRIKLDEKQKVEYTYRAFRAALRRYYSSSSAEVRRLNLLRAAQIRSYVRDSYRNGSFEGDPCEFFETGSPQLDIIHFYEMRDDLSRGLSPVCQVVKDIVFRAHQSIILELMSASAERYPALLRQAVDIQNFMFEGLLNRTLPADFLDLMNYPRDKRFHYLILNSYYFKHHEAYELMREYNPDYFVKIPRSIYPQKNTYYYILKETVLHDEFNMIIRSPGYFQFELYDFLAFYSINPWEPEILAFFDEEVDDKVIGEQLERLMKLNSIICDRQVYQLFLDYHTKAAYHHYIKSGPDNPQTLTSLGKLYQYFYSRKDKLKPEITRQIALTFLWYSKNSFDKDLLQYAYDILESQFSRGNTDSITKALYMKVKSFYTDKVAAQGSRDRLQFGQEEWCKLFRGPYNISYSEFDFLPENFQPCLNCLERE